MKDFKRIIGQLNSLKDNKKNFIILIVGFILIALIFISEIFPDNVDKTESKSKEDSTIDYCTYLEEKVTDIVQSIDGAGETRVMITLLETTEYVYATNDKNVRKNNNENDDSTSENDYVIIENNNADTGLLIKTIEPKIRGVAVVCEGGDNVKVQNQIYSAVGAVLNVSTSRISISKLTNTEE